MIDTPKTAPSPPGLTAIEQIVADLESKRQKEEERNKELKNLLAESDSRYDWLDNTITGLRNEYGIKNGVTPDTSQDTEQSDLQTHKEVATPVNNTSHEIPSKNGQAEPWEKPSSIKWLDLIRDAIRKQDNLVTQLDVMTYLNMDEPSKKKHSQTLSGTLTAYRSSGQLIGIPVYQRTPHGKAISQFLTGIPEFFSDPETKQLKSEYEAKLQEKVRAIGFYLSDIEATRA